MGTQKFVQVEQRRTVAVVSVHGVGDQKPFETAQKIGDLLQELSLTPPDPTKKPPACAHPTPESPRYYPFREQKIRINVNPVVVRGADEAREAPQTPTTLGPFNAFVKAELEKVESSWNPPKEVREKQPAENYDLFTEFTKRQLACYAGDKPEDTFETVRLEGTRADGNMPLDVHIYELYWADLSRLKAGLFSIFTELYQLLFHLSSLGVNAVNAAALDHPNESRWRWLRRLQSWTSTILTVPIPVFNLLMLGVFGVLLGVLVLDSRKPATRVAVLVAVATAFLIGGTGVALWRRLKTKLVTRWVWIGAFFAWIVAGALLGYALVEQWKPPNQLLDILESIVLVVAVAGILFLVLRAYNRRKPGVLKWGLILSAVLLAGLPTVPSLDDSLKGLASTVPQFWVREFEVLYAALTLSWGFFFLLSIINCLSGLFAVSGSTGEKRDLAVRSRWTGWIMLAIPAFAFLVVTVIGWGLLAYATAKLIPTHPYYPFLPWIKAANVTTIKGMADAFLTGPVEIMLPIILLFAGVAALPAIWGLAPVVWSEVFPPPSYKALDRSKSVPLGHWLTLTYRGALFVSGLLIYLAMTFVVPAGAVAKILHLPWSIPGFRYLGIISGVAFGWLFLARGSLKKLALGFRPALDLLLDVDNWFREHPLDSNPKARICGRYVSLLRYICNWKNDANPHGYEKLVVIAHSQGTVITADLLRFLHRPVGGGSIQRWRDLDPQLAPLGRHANGRQLPVHFFTMGCPLRQLYSLRFPYLYRWARHQNQADMLNWQANDLLLVPPPAPDPAELGVDRWVNAFRSGDYVGRHLWRSEPCGYLWSGDARIFPIPQENNSTDGTARAEFCIGAGAHTHYWDETAPMVAQELDALII